jgi:hypothetical protein
MNIFWDFLMNKFLNKYLYIVIIYHWKAFEKENLFSMCRTLAAHMYTRFKDMKARMSLSHSIPPDYQAFRPLKVLRILSKRLETSISPRAVN